MKILVLNEKCTGCPFLAETNLIKAVGFCFFGGTQRELKSLDIKENGCELPDYEPIAHK